MRKDEFPIVLNQDIEFVLARQLPVKNNGTYYYLSYTIKQVAKVHYLFGLPVLVELKAI